jgi:hypothetical protein
MLHRRMIFGCTARPPQRRRRQSVAMGHITTTLNAAGQPFLERFPPDEVTDFAFPRIYMHQLSCVDSQYHLPCISIANCGEHTVFSTSKQICMAIFSQPHSGEVTTVLLRLFGLSRGDYSHTDLPHNLMSRSSSNSQTRRNLPPASARIRIANDNHIQREHDREGPIPSSLSLLSARRPSWAPPLYDHSQESISSGLASYRDVPTHGFVAQASKRSQPSTSPDDGGNFRRSLQIDMKDLVGDAVGSVSVPMLSACVVQTVQFLDL